MNLGMMIGVILDRSRALYIGITGVFITWLLNSLSSIEAYPEFAKPLSPFYYFDLHVLSQEFDLESKLLVLVVISVFLFVIGLSRFRKKDIYV